MGVYIKGIEIPLQCYDCYLVANDPDTQKLYCKLLNRDIENPSDKFADCPLVEVKSPHGRLKDVDAIIKEHGFEMFDHSVEVDAEYIDNAPTIIEAEE